MLLALAAVVLAIALVAYGSRGSIGRVGGSGEPSEAEIRTAYEKAVANAIQGADIDIRNMMGENAGKLYELRKHECNRQKDAPGYVCSVTVDLEMPMEGRQKGTENLTFVKGSDGWVLQP